MLQKEAPKVAVFSEVSLNGVLKSSTRQSSSDSFSARKRKARDVIFQMLWNETLVSKLSAASNMDAKENKKGSRA